MSDTDSVSIDSSMDEDIIQRTAAEALAKDNAEAVKRQKIEVYLNEKIYKDTSPEARAGRRRAAMRAAYGEFMCTLLFLTPIFMVVCNGASNNWAPEALSLSVAFVGGLQAVGVSFAFSSVSGAHFNPSVSFALWLTGKLSNRKCFVYIFVQLLASVVGMLIVLAIFPDDDFDFKTVAITPPHDNYLGKVFATEFFTTFILIYTAFTVAFEDAEKNKKDTLSVKTLADTRGLTVYASNPQSKTGFAPFSIGFTIFSLSLVGGASGGAFNQARMFGPALISNRWDYFYLYYIAQLLGGSCAGLLVHNLHRFGLQKDPVQVDETPLAEALAQAKLAKSLGKPKAPLSAARGNPLNDQVSSDDM